MYNPCDFYIDGKKLKKDEFLAYVKKMDLSKINEVLGGIPSFKNIPSAPFITETPAYTKLGLKVALKEAVKQNAKILAWTSGEQQNDRYDLSKQVNAIDYSLTSKTDGGKYIDIHTNKNETISIRVDKNGIIETEYSEYKGRKLEDLIGKDISEKILKDEKNGTLEGEGLKFGGKGMKGFYGSPEEKSLGIVGNVAKSLFKQEPKTINLTLPPIKGFFEPKETIIGSTQHSIDITPELKAEVEGGLPLFKDIKGRGKELADLLRKGKIKLGGLQSNIAGIPIAVYNGLIEVTARALEKGASLTQAISEAYKKLKIKERYKDFKQAEFIKKLEDATGEKFTDPIEETPPPKQTSEPTVDDSEGGKKGITHEATQETTRKAGLPDYKGQEPNTHEERIAAAKKAIKDNPNLHNEIMEKVEKGGNLTPQDNAVLAVYKGALDKELESAPSKELYDQISRIAKVLNPEGTYAGKLLESRKLIDFEEDNLANFLMGKEASQGTALTESQIKSESAKYTELKEAKEKLEVELAEEREKYQKLAAEIGVNKAKAAARKASKKSHEEHIKDRKAILDAARADLKKIREQGLHSTIPGIQELKALAPHVKSFMQDLLNEGVDKFDNIVSAIHAEFKDVLDNLRKVDIIDILAGDHDTVKEKTRNEKAAELRLTIREAKLIKELAAERKGEEKAKSERDKVVSNRRIDELTEKIKEVKRLNKEKAEEPLPSEQKLLSDYIDKLTQKANKLSKDIKEKKYLEEKPIPPAFKKSRKAQMLEDRVIDLENKIRHERSAAEYQKRSKIRKAFDKVMEVLGVRRLVQSAVDISVPFRQGATLISPRRIDIWAKGFKANLQSVFSPKKFERIMYEIRHDPMYHDMIKDKVVFNDMGAADPILHNEDFRKSFVYKIPIISEPLKASNRSADAFLNIARLEIYKKMRAKLERQGFTREANPKEFEYIGNWAMSMTGRGRMTNMLENSVAHTVLGNTFYGARLMASRFNLLNPVTYFDPRFSREAKVEAMKDMAAFTVTVMSSALALAAAGGKVSLNPDDSDFLQVRFGKKVYDISGGLAAYVRTFLRIAKAGYTKATGTRYEGKQATDKAALSILRFFRNKLSPNTSYGVDAFFGKDYGRKFDPMEIAAIYPMYADDVLKALKEDGLLSLATVLLPNILGIGYGSYASKGEIDANLDDLLKRNLRSDEMNSEKILNFKEGGRPVTFKEFNEFADKRDEEIKNGIEDLYKNGIEVIDDNFKIKTKPYKELTQEEVVKETSAIKSKATKKVKLELFGENKKSITDQLKENLLEQHKNIKSLTNGK